MGWIGNVRNAKQPKQTRHHKNAGMRGVKLNGATSYGQENKHVMNGAGQNNIAVLYWVAPLPPTSSITLIMTSHWQLCRSVPNTTGTSIFKLRTGTLPLFWS